MSPSTKKRLCNPAGLWAPQTKQLGETGNVLRGWVFNATVSLASGPGLDARQVGMNVCAYYKSSRRNITIPRRILFPARIPAARVMGVNPRETGKQAAVAADQDVHHTRNPVNPRYHQKRSRTMPPIQMLQDMGNGIHAGQEALVRQQHTERALALSAFRLAQQASFRGHPARHRCEGAFRVPLQNPVQRGTAQGAVPVIN